MADFYRQLKTSPSAGIKRTPFFFGSSERKKYLNFEIKFMILEVEKNALSEVSSGYARLAHGAFVNGEVVVTCAWILCGALY